MSAKDLIVKPIVAKDASAFVKKNHYSGKVVTNSSLHFGVFWDGQIEGVMSFGSPMDKRRSLGLVRDTPWHDMLELNRMVFSEKLPRNSESRALSVSFRLIKKHYPNIKWIQTFADGTACGDGTIYRASGFHLTGVNPNSTIYVFPDGARIASLSLTNGENLAGRRKACEKYGAKFSSKASMKPFIDIGAKKAGGFMVRYIYFIDKSYKEKLTVPIIPFSKIDEMGAGMYKGLKRGKKQEPEHPSGLGGAIPTPTLHISTEGLLSDG